MGPVRETIGTIILDIGASFGLQGELLRLIRQMQESRMGFYIHRGRKGKSAVLEDMATGVVHRASVPSGYSGRKGELWYARVLPPPMPGGAESIVFTTPYIVLHPGLPEYREYFRRTLPLTGAGPTAESHLKYGPSTQYWNDFVFEAYLNHRAEAIFLAGLPDVPESRPHSRISEANGWAVPASLKAPH